MTTDCPLIRKEIGLMHCKAARLHAIVVQTVQKRMVMKQILSPKQLADAIGVSESSLKRWADEGLLRATRTAGGHRRIPVAEAIRFVRETQATLVRPEILGLPDVESISGDLPARRDEADRLYLYLSEGRSLEARGLVMSMYLSGRPVAEICDGPVREAMARIGDIWQHDPEGIFVEHRATDICLQAMEQLRMTFQVDDDWPVAVGGGPSKDPYILPSLMIATALSAEGIRAVNLGPDTPVETLIHAAASHQARLVWLSLSSESASAQLNGDIAQLARRLAELGTSLILGGQARDRIAPIRRSNVHFGGSIGELVAYAKGVIARSDDATEPARNSN
jgi:excisionase family DNA binding protein